MKPKLRSTKNIPVIVTEDTRLVIITIPDTNRASLFILRAMI